MKTRLAILGLASSILLATSNMLPVAPAVADDYWIGNYRYAIPGAAVHSSVFCQDSRHYAIYELTATDAGPRRYWLAIEDADLPAAIISHTGLVAIEGTDMVWPYRDVGDVVTVSVWAGPCWPRDEDQAPEPRYVLSLPLLVR